MVMPLDNGVFVREDLWSLPRWDPTLVWYALAMGAMFQKPISDSSSWRYQAAIHGYDDTLPALRALKKPGETLPADQNIYWKQCQHHGWYFLPWHRGYLGYFERIVRKTIIALGGPDTWALPYWNYSDTQTNQAVARLMRPEFLEPTLPNGTPTVPDGTANPLFHGVARGAHTLVQTPKGQAGDFGIGPNDVRLKCLADPHFYDHASATSFGGGVTGFSHGESGVDVTGGVEKTPHNNVHGDIGGADGWMGSFETAGLDPIFWLHHSNIDRLWSVWGLDASHADPTGAAWLTPAGVNFPFRFRDENGVSQILNPGAVVDAATSAFTYKYESLAAPSTAGFAAKLQPGPAVTQAPPSQPPQRAAATTSAIDLTSEQVAVDLPIATQAPALTLLAATGPRQVFLNVENVMGSGPLETRYVYLNLAPAETPADQPELYAGSLPMFGVREMSSSGEPHGGSGKNFVLNVTDVVAQLQKMGRWDGKTVRVLLVAKHPPSPAERLTVGQISLYYR